VIDVRRSAMANSKDVVVTGVSTGIGLGTTQVLVSKGFRVFGSVRKQADGDRLQREFGDGFVPLVLDITDADAVHQAAQRVGSMIGDRNLVGLVNNAGVVVSGPLLYLRPSEYRRQLEVNMISPLVVIQAFAPLLGTNKKRQGPAGSSTKHVLTAYPLSVWAKPSIWHSARQNLRHATQSFRNVSRTGLCSDFFL
jgi:NAD(P)-dependent dehydrogenase (short-subunit alcohol dehydrogenase family)